MKLLKEAVVCKCQKLSDKDAKEFEERLYDTLSPSDQNVLLGLCDSILTATDKRIGYYVDGVLVGGIFVIKKLGNTHIEWLFVDPEYRGMKIGETLVKLIIVKSNLPKITTNPYTSEAEQFFKKLGFYRDENLDPDDDNVMVYQKR